MPPAKKANWIKLLDKNFATDDGVPNLESVCRAAVGRIGEPIRRRQLILTIPEPILGQTNWGEISGKALDFRRMADRLAAIEWYLDLALQKWQSFAAKQLELAGFYWGYENTRGKNDFFPAVAKLVHARGKQFFWIPYWDKTGSQDQWKALGFDAAWQQPNHFFHPELPDSRLNEACAFARQHGMGLEMEFDGSMISDPEKFVRRFDAYLDVFAQMGVKDTSSIAYYEGGGALHRLAVSADPQVRAHYDRIARFILDRQKLADEKLRICP